jgi:hypothetical protein
VLADALEKVVFDLVVVGHGLRVVQDDAKRVPNAPKDAYHVHVRALVAHSSQKKSLKNTHTSEELLKTVDVPEYPPVFTGGSAALRLFHNYQSYLRHPQSHG